MTNHLFFLVVAGFAAGLVASLGGLGSLVSYPSLLLYGLAPVTANVTNTTALTTLILGSAAGGRAELRGLRKRLLVLSSLAGLGGACGALLLLLLPSSVFERVVPLLVAAGSLMVLGRDRIRTWLDRNRDSELEVRVGRSPWVLGLAVTLTGVYTGYFGAAAGVAMLAILAIHYDEPHAVTNAVRVIVTAAANVVAAVIFVVLAPVDWPAVLALGSGLFLGSFWGMRLVPRLPGHRLRAVVGYSGLLLASWLAVKQFLL